MWVDKREETILRAELLNKQRLVQRDMEGKTIVDAAIIQIRTKVHRLCSKARHLDEDIRVPYGDVGFLSHCNNNLKDVCKSADWPLTGPCAKLMNKGCQHLAKKMDARLLELAELQAKSVNNLALAVGVAWSKKCDDLSSWMHMLLDRYLGTVQTKLLIEDKKEELANIERVLLSVTEKLANYQHKMVHDGSHTFACARVPHTDVRKQNFKCMAQTDAPLKLIVCKGDQYQRVLADAGTALCPTGSSVHQVAKVPGELPTRYEARADFAKMAFGCECPWGTTPQQGKCCRFGELVYSAKEWNAELNATVQQKPRCQCLPGFEYVLSPLGGPKWQRKCMSHQAKREFHTCVDETGYEYDHAKGRIECCQAEEGDCKPACPEGHWRLADGFCHSALTQGCQKFSTDDYYGGYDVRCLLPVSEVLINKKECEAADGNEWIDSDVFGGSYCKRPEQKWGSLNDPRCTYRISSDEKNEDKCTIFDKRSFRVAPQNNLNIDVSYFSLVAETMVTAEGTSISGEGEREMTADESKGYNGHNENLPYTYQTFTPLIPQSDWDSVRDKPKSAEHGRRKLLFTSAQNEDGQVLELQESNALEQGDVIGESSQVSLAAAKFVFPGPEDPDMVPKLHPSDSADIEQQGYLGKPPPGRWNDLPGKVPAPSGGFYRYVGIFKLSQWPKLEDPWNVDTLIQVDEQDKSTTERGTESDDDEYDPIKEAMEEMHSARKDWNRAKDVKHPPLHSIGPGEGSTKKLCAAPPKQAQCFANIHSGEELRNVAQHDATGIAHQCLNPQDHAWFRILCEQY